MINSKYFKKIFCLLLFFYSTIAFSQTISFKDILKEIQVSHSSQVNYSQRQYMNFLKKPVVTHGEFYFKPPHHIEQRVLYPRFQHIVIDNGYMTFNNGNTLSKVNLSQYPNIQTMMMTLNSLLTNDKTYLQEHYKIQSAGNISNWTLTLNPKTTSLSNLQLIQLIGKRNQINTLIVHYKNGNRLIQKFISKRNTP